MRFGEMDYNSVVFCLLKMQIAVTGVAQWVGCHPANRKLTCLIPSQGRCLHCGPGPQWGTREKQSVDVSPTYQCFTPSGSPSFPLSLKIHK